MYVFDPLFDFPLKFQCSIVFFTVILAISIPHLGFFMSLVGALASSVLALAFPALVDLCVLYPNFGKFNYVLVRDFIIIVIGVFALISGVSITIIERYS